MLDRLIIQMTKADFIRNNRGIDDGKDLAEEYLGALYDQIVKNEIKMKADSSVPQSKQENSFNKLLGLDGILNLVTGKQTEEKALGANGLHIKDIQEQFKEKSGNQSKLRKELLKINSILNLKLLPRVLYLLLVFWSTKSDKSLALVQCKCNILR